MKKVKRTKKLQQRGCFNLLCNTSTCFRRYLFYHDWFFFFCNLLYWFFSLHDRLWLGHFKYKKEAIEVLQSKHTVFLNRCRYEFFKINYLDTCLCFFLWSNFLLQLLGFVSDFRFFGNFLNFYSSLRFALFNYKAYKEFSRKLSTNTTF